MRKKKAHLLPADHELDRLARIIRGSGVAIRLENLLRTPGQQGRRREASAELFLLIAFVLISTVKSVRGADVEAMIASGEVERLCDRLDGLPGVRSGPRAGRGSRKPVTIHKWRRFWGDVANLAYDDVFELTNLLLLAWLPTPPPLGDRILFDATPVETHARPLNQDLRKALAKEGSEDLLLNRERKLPAKEQAELRHRRAHRAHEANFGHATKTRKQPKKMLGGYHLHPVICTTGPSAEASGSTAPTLVVATDVTPASGYSSPDQLKRLLGFVRSRYDLADDAWVVADRDYSKRFEIWRWLREEGRPFAFDLREEQLEPRGDHLGAVLAQGNALCPATPRHLRNPGKRPMTKTEGGREPNPAYAAWLERVRGQAPFRARVRSVRPHGINVACPALAPSPMVDCPLRGDLDRRSRRPVVLDPPSKRNAPPICKQKTVFIPDTVNPLRQTARWGTPEWLQAHRHGRARNEGVHGELKHPQGYGLAGEVTASSRRNVVAIHAALVLALLNYDKVWAFIDTNPRHPFSKTASSAPLFLGDEEQPKAA